MEIYLKSDSQEVNLDIDHNFLIEVLSSLNESKFLIFNKRLTVKMLL